MAGTARSNSPRRPQSAVRDQLDGYVWWRLKRLLIKRYGRNLHAGRAAAWDRDFFWAHGLHRLRGTVQYPTQKAA